MKRNGDGEEAEGYTLVENTESMADCGHTHMPDAKLSFKKKVRLAEICAMSTSVALSQTF